VIALIDYGAGNLTSVRKALAHLDAPVVTPASPAELADCAGAIVPGVGNFEVTAALDAGTHGGWIGAIRDTVAAGRPLLGICVGLQWLFEGSEEAPTQTGLGVFDGRCALITNGGGGTNADGSVFKVPHVGWDSLDGTRDSWLLDGVREGEQVYFTHSYAAPVTGAAAATTTYGVEFASVVERDNVAGVQFHPEKSGAVGLKILRNFLERVRTSRT
jgi:glutamine amidotransferase